MKEQTITVENMDKKLKKTNNDPFMGEVNNLIDMGIGELGFTESVWNKYSKKNSFCLTEGLKYDYGQSNDNTNILRKEIIKIHSSIKNFSGSTENIIIANGASQLISAVSYAASEVYGIRSFLIKKPYWSRIPALLKFGFNLSTTKKHSKHKIEFLTVPNNPNFSLNFNIKSKKNLIVYDHCYNWSHYIDEVVRLDNGDIYIYSLGKLSGHTGIRIGWAFVKDPKIAKKMKEYIELTTSGISYSAIKFATHVLKFIRNNKKVLKDFNKILKNRWDLINKIKIKDFVIVGEKNGIFAYCMLNYDEDAQEYMRKNYGIHCIGGEAFGDSKNFFRLNIGCSHKNFLEFIKVLEKKNVETSKTRDRRFQVL